ncbi:exonuclease [Flagellimonas taeanensis]|uniref:DNA polymerase-3 subunit epsilon n=1 Tax=Flagellimonas taeanensis TaxID=1005926 RepID=A0A1M7BZ20_9FLAO|nr:MULTISPECIES: exonuclease domain-containing protein [Allomuricauda]MDC6386823.1 exonuclease domain-containing protein [Muricauda sp. SK9]MEE1964031.1 exonuclease domain-containing protein [Allomuricauda taeanensis]RIV49314.1 exonuclease [Allomuricauda taeanensis]SFC50732.1 DNA polymerase-3 subunit epsilon [Allomuricauda taeanensis]SHL59829.1 DNA polymerase-3 subunit epsilon [Allomuricauda taeanensis]
MYAILDIESTGGKYNEEGIMEIAIYRFDGHQIVDQFICLINPEREIQPFVSKLTGINNAMLRSAPKFHEVAKRIVEITEGAVIVAHNAQFDYRILRTEYRRLGYDYQRKTLCTVDLSKQLIPEAESHSLGKLARSLGIATSDRHRANGDALATLKLFKLLLSKDTDKKIITEVMREETHGELSPNQLDIVLNLPSETGVYYMYDKDGDLIFIGKTKNIKKRVNQHFTNVGSLARKLQKDTKKVAYETTGSELLAVLKEYLETFKNKPKYNNNPRKKLFSHIIGPEQNDSGYITLKIEKSKSLRIDKMGFNGLVSAKSFLEKVRSEFELCPCSIEGDKNQGAHDKDTVEECNAKTLSVMEKYSTYAKDMVILDRGRETGERSFILIKSGVVQGYGHVELNYQINNIPILESIMTPMSGDENVTFIIQSFLRKNNAPKTIVLNPKP